MDEGDDAGEEEDDDKGSDLFPEKRLDEGSFVVEGFVCVLRTCSLSSNEGSSPLRAQHLSFFMPRGLSEYAGDCKSERFF